MLSLMNTIVQRNCKINKSKIIEFRYLALLDGNFNTRSKQNKVSALKNATSFINTLPKNPYELLSTIIFLNFNQLF